MQRGAKSTTTNMAAAEMLGVSKTGQMVIALGPTTDTRFMTDITVAQLRRQVEVLSASEGKGDDAKAAIREILRCAKIYADVIDPQGPPSQSSVLALPAPPAPVQRKKEIVEVAASEGKPQSLVLRQKEVVKEVTKETTGQVAKASPTTDPTLAAAEEQSEATGPEPLEEASVDEGDLEEVLDEEIELKRRHVDGQVQEEIEEENQEQTQKNFPKAEAAPTEGATVEKAPAQSFATPVQSLNAFPQCNQPYYTQSGLFIPPQEPSFYAPPQYSGHLVPPPQKRGLVQWSDVTDIPNHGATMYPEFHAQQYESSQLSTAVQPSHLSMSSSALFPRAVAFTPGASAFVPRASAFLPNADAFVPGSSALTEDVTQHTDTENSKGEEYNTLFVENLGSDIDGDALHQTFSECAGLKSARVPIKDRRKGGSRGFGYIEFETHEQARTALDSMNGIEVQGRALRLDPSYTRTAQQQIAFADRQKTRPPVTEERTPAVEQTVAARTTSESAPTPQPNPVDRTDSPSTGPEPHNGRHRAKRLRELQKAASMVAHPAKIEATSIGEFTLETPSSSPMISSAASVVENTAPESSAGKHSCRYPEDDQDFSGWKPFVTRHTHSVRELEVVVWVPREERDPPAATLEPVDKTAWFNAQYETITNIKAHKAHVTDLGHILALFPSAEDRDEFKANASQWLKSGRTVIDEFFDIVAIIDDINTYRYLAAKLVNAAGRQAVVNRIMRQNFENNPDAQILRIEWVNQKQRRPLEVKNFVTDSIIITFSNAMDANAILEHNLLLKEDSLLTFIYRTQLPILQCNNCGRLGHHEARCWYDMRCLKCTRPHATATCRLRPESWKCVLCQNSHHSKDNVCPVRKQEKELIEGSRPPLGHFHPTATNMEDNRRQAADHMPHWQEGSPSTAFDEFKLARPLNERPRLVQMVEDWQDSEVKKNEGEGNAATDEAGGRAEQAEREEVEDFKFAEEEAGQSSTGHEDSLLPQMHGRSVATDGWQNMPGHLSTDNKPGSGRSDSEEESASVEHVQEVRQDESNPDDARTKKSTTSSTVASEATQDGTRSQTAKKDCLANSSEASEQPTAGSTDMSSQALAGATGATAQSSNAPEKPTERADENGKPYFVAKGCLMLTPTPVKPQSTILEKPSGPSSASTMPKAMKRDAARVDSPIGSVSATMHKKQKLSDSSILQPPSQPSTSSWTESDEKTLIGFTSPIKNAVEAVTNPNQTNQEQATSKSPSSAEHSPTKPVFTPIPTEILRRTIISKSTPSPKPVVDNTLSKPKPLPTRYTSTVEELQLYVVLPGNERQTMASGTDRTEWLNAAIAGRTTMKPVQAVVTELQHLLVTFDSAEDREDFIKDGKKWLKGGRKVMSGTYDVQLTIDKTSVMTYLSSELLKKSGRTVVRQIMLENQGIIPNATILRIGWNPKRAPRLSGASNIKNLKPIDQPAIFVTFGTAEDANAALGKGLTILGKNFSVSKYLHKYNILQCLNCGALGHHTARCWEDTRCLKCGRSHPTDECVNPALLRCALCEKAHDSRINDCKIRQQEQNFVRANLVQNMTGAKY